MGAVNSARRRKVIVANEQLIKYLNRTYDRTVSGFPHLARRYPRKYYKFNIHNIRSRPEKYEAAFGKKIMLRP
jgi:hypothetical protein